jgi:hypothetical protein
LEKCLKDYDASANQSPIVISQVPIVSSQPPIVLPQAPITHPLHVNKRIQDQTPELQISDHANKEFLNKLPLCDTQGFNCKQFKNSLIIHDENTKKNHKRVVSLCTS